MLTSKSHLWLWENFTSILSFPSRHIVFLSKKHMLLWSVGSFVSLLKHVRILVKEHQDYFSLTLLSQELRRSEFFITNWGYVGVRASLLSAAPQSLSYWPWGHVTCGDKLWSFHTPFLHSDTVVSDGTHRQIMVILHLLSSRGGRPDDMQRQIIVIPHTFSPFRHNCVRWHAETSYGHSATFVI